MSILSQIVSPYVPYKNKYGLSAVRVRTWHPDIVIPLLLLRFYYWRGRSERYANYEDVLYSIYCILSDKSKNKAEQIKEIIENDICCGFGCDYTEPYGFVPEAGCPIHDI